MAADGAMMRGEMDASRRRLALSIRAIHRALANPDIRRIEITWTLAISSQWALTVALLVYGYEQGGEVAVGILGVVRTLPALLGVPLAASLADRVSHVRVLIGLHLLAFSAATACLLALALQAPLPLVFTVAGVSALAGTAIRPVQTSLLPSLARTPEELVASNVTTSMLEGVGGIVGPALAGAVLGFGMPPAAGVATVASLLAVVVAIGIRTVEIPRQHGEGSGERLADGIVALRELPAPRTIVFLLATQTLTRGLLNVFVMVASVELLGLGNGGVSSLSTALGVGGLVGIVVTILMIGQSRLMPFAIGALVAWGLSLSVIGAAGLAPVAFAMMAVIGAANAVEDVALYGGLQRVVPHRVRASVFGAAEGIFEVATGAGALIAPVLIGLLGIGPAMVVGGLLLPGATILRARALLAVDDVSLVPARELALLRGIPMFELLPIAAIEEIAGRLRSVQFAADEPLMRQGEPGDRYFVLASGRASVSIDGRTVRELGPGDGVGEIALLRQVPRTATVIALEPLEALELDGPSFVAAVTGDELAAGAAGRVVEGRLAASPD